MMPYVALFCPKLPYFTLSCPTLPYVAPSYPKVGLNCSKAESRVPRGVVGWCWWGGVVVQTNNHLNLNVFKCKIFPIDTFCVIKGNFRYNYWAQPYYKTIAFSSWACCALPESEVKVHWSLLALHNCRNS